MKTECGSELSAGIRGALSHVKKTDGTRHRALSLLEIEVEAGWSGPRRSCLAWLLFGRRGVWISPGTRRRDSGQRRAPSAAPICPCVIRTSGTQPASHCPLALAGRRALQGALARCAHDPNRTADCFPVPCRSHGCRIGRALATFMNDAPGAVPAKPRRHSDGRMGSPWHGPCSLARFVVLRGSGTGKAASVVPVQRTDGNRWTHRASLVPTDGRGLGGADPSRHASRGNGIGTDAVTWTTAASLRAVRARRGGRQTSRGLC